jgi:hypothetical protein
MDGAFLEWALEAFSGYGAAEELSEGPSCGLSAVAHRQSRRILYKVLDHAPTQDDLKAFLGRLKTALDDRALALKGSTTDGSVLYPEPSRAVFGEVPQQLCPFPVIKDLVNGGWKAVAAERERLAKSTPKLKRGRPASKDKEARRLARPRKRMRQKSSDVFPHRVLFGKRRLTPSARKPLLPITRGLPHLRKLRELMEHRYGLFDRRCRTQTALDKLRKRRQWVQRFPWMGDT